MNGLVYQEKLQIRDELLLFLMDGAGLIGKIHESAWKTILCFKTSSHAHSSARGHFRTVSHLSMCVMSQHNITHEQNAIPISLVKIIILICLFL